MDQGCHHALERELILPLLVSRRGILYNIYVAAAEADAFEDAG